MAMCLPISAGAMSNLWAAVAGDWHASADAVALVNGALDGVVSMVGCIIGGWICDKMNRMVAFNLFSIVLAASALAMAFAPRTASDVRRSSSGSISFINGFGFAAWGAVVLEAIGKGAAATKYNILAGIANFPIIYLTKMDGWAQTRWGSTGMLLTEAAVPVDRNAGPDPLRAGDEGPSSGEARAHDLTQRGAEALDARAGLFQQLVRGRVGNAEERRQPERRAMDHRHAFGLQQLAGEIPVARDRLARRRLSCRSACGSTDRRRTPLPAWGIRCRSPG